MDVDGPARAYREETQRARDAAAREAIEHHLVGCRGNVTHTAEVLGMTRPHLHRLIKQHGLVEVARKLRFADAGRKKRGDSK